MFTEARTSYCGRDNILVLSDWFRISPCLCSKKCRSSLNIRISPTAKSTESLCKKESVSFRSRAHRVSWRACVRAIRKGRARRFCRTAAYALGRFPQLQASFFSRQVEVRQQSQSFRLRVSTHFSQGGRFSILDPLHPFVPFVHAHCEVPRRFFVGCLSFDIYDYPAGKGAHHRGLSSTRACSDATAPCRLCGRSTTAFTRPSASSRLSTTSSLLMESRSSMPVSPSLMHGEGAVSEDAGH